MADKGDAKKSAPASRGARPLHPAVLTAFGPGRGSASSELAAWAYLTRPRPFGNAGGGDGDEEAPLPNLVTAQSNSLRVYTVLPHAGTLALTAVYDNLAGSVCSLDVIPRGTSGVRGECARCSEGGGRADGGKGGEEGGGTADDEGLAAIFADATTGNTNDDNDAARACQCAYDGLLLGFAGHPRLSLVYPSAPMVGGGAWSTSSTSSDTDGSHTGVGTGGVLLASAIIDLGPALAEHGLGGTSFMEQDIVVAASAGAAGDHRGGNETDDDPTVAVVLGGGVAPYVLPLPALSAKIRDLAGVGGAASTPGPSNPPGRRNQQAAAAPATASLVSHGFGDILDVAFLNGYTEPTLAVLHSNPRHGGRAWPGRMGRTAEVPLTTDAPSSSAKAKAAAGAAGHYGPGKVDGDDMDTGDEDEEEAAKAPVETVDTGTKHALTLTAISLAVRQRRSVVLWTLMDSIPADAWSLVPHPADGVLAVGVNAVTYVTMGGRIDAALATNGFAKIGCPPGLLPPAPNSAAGGAGQGRGRWGGRLAPNPAPLPLLAVQLDGARTAFVSEDVALVCLGNGTLHALEVHRRRSSPDDTVLSLFPLGHKVGGMGCASCLAVLPAAARHGGSVGRYLAEEAEDGGRGDRTGARTRGLAFVGSRMGDCTLLAYAMDGPVRLAGAATVDEGGARTSEDGAKPADAGAKDGPARKRPKREGGHAAPAGDDDDGGQLQAINSPQPTEEEILRREEEELYRDDDGGASPSVVSASRGDSDESADEEGGASDPDGGTEGRPRVRSLATLASLRALDSLAGLGPLGGGCFGPVATCPSSALAPPSGEGSDAAQPTPLSGAFASAAGHYVLPCGYGASGGLAVLTTPGRDSVGGSILCESDLCDASAVFGLAKSNLVLLGRSDGKGCVALRGVVRDDGGEGGGSAEAFEEVEVGPDGANAEDGMDVDDGPAPSFENASDVLGRMTLLAASEFASHSATFSVFFVKAPPSQDTSPLAIVVMSDDKKSQGGVGLRVIFVHEIQNADSSKGALASVTPMVGRAAPDDASALASVAFGCVWTSGDASLFNVALGAPKKTRGKKKAPSFPVEFGVSETVFAGDAAEEDDVGFYDSNKVVAMDVVSLPAHVFDAPRSASVEGEALPTATTSAAVPPAPDRSSFLSFPPDRLSMHGTWCAHSGEAPPTAPDRIVVAICRRSGLLQIYDNEDASASPVIEATSDEVRPVWQASGCSHGTAILGQSAPGVAVRRPEIHEVEAAEVRFFVAGPSLKKAEGVETTADAEKDAWMLRSLLLLVDTNQGDLHLYSGSKRASHAHRLEFARVPLATVARPSEEAGRHLTKLRRKGLAPSSAAARDDFRPNRLHRFGGVSGEDGLFAATPRPLWFVSERGAPTVVSHKSRHVSPAGGRPVPVAGFCAAMPDVFQNASSGFITIHERIGRVGSQRLTLYNGLWDVFAPHGLLPGGGMSIQKIPLGVTVRHIEFIDDASISSTTRPVYAMLVSHEMEADQSNLNDDGLTPEERQRIKDEKEAANVQKQVEADLGGFDMEQEWVEEIERDECFAVDTRLGLAPPMPTRMYELWLVDAAKGWKVLDRHTLDEYEHGTALKVMYLTDVVEDSDETPERSLFISVGTSTIDNDGEDLASRGKILLFQVKKSKKRALGKSNQDPPLELFLKSEKDMALGPVTSLSSLRSGEDIYRIVVGAGAEITVEQWGSGKLTQVGFYHAHMQVQQVVLFKTFFLLSDAYDSLHFLVWRESDKSLTLLAKDYEPCNVFATGLISRGGAVSFVCHDDRQNLSFLQYAPADAAARGGNKLVCRADFHLGSQTTSLRSHWSQSSLLFNSCTMNSTLAALKQQDALFGRLEDDQRFSVNFGTSDGSFGSVVPLSEPTYWRLTALQSVMSNALESNCALSHRAWRLYRRSTRRAGCRSNDRKKGVIDGDLVMKFVDLSLPEQEDLASSIGSTVALVLDNLLELGCAASVV
ncbi:hypothetical protein ACHAXT_012123 [Thalassiosira profunda]